jgi:replicative DNA helicase
MDIKELPNSEEMEKALLGALIIDDKLVTQFFNEGEVEWFYSPNHKTIAKTIYKLALEGGAIDLVTLKDSLSTDGKLDVIG